MRTFKMKVLTLFSGIGAPERALTNLGIDYELVGFCERDKYAAQSYCAVHHVDPSLNLGDITQVTPEDLPEQVDLLVFGSPCTSFSRAGKGEGGVKGSGTASSLLWNAVDIIEQTKPTLVVWENVSDVLNEKHRPVFDDYLDKMSELGYVSTYQVLCAKDYGIPQNRKRLFVVSRLDGVLFSFPDPQPLRVTAMDYLEKSVDASYYVDNPFEKVGDNYHIPQATKKGYIELKTGICDWSYPNSKLRRGRVQGGGTIVPTLTASKQNLYYLDEWGQTRTLTSLERWRLMGFEDDDFYAAKNTGVSDAQLYKQAGNSIVVSVLEAIFKTLIFKNN